MIHLSVIYVPSVFYISPPFQCVVAVGLTTLPDLLQLASLLPQKYTNTTAMRTFGSDTLANGNHDFEG